MPDPPVPPAAQRLGSRRLVRLAILFYGGMLAIAWLWRSGLRGASLWVAEPGATIDWVRDPALGAAAAAAVIALSAAFTRHTEIGRALARALGALLGPLRWRDCALLALLSGVGEEALFRGALQPEVGLVAASLLFGVVHFAPQRELRAWTIFAIGAGFLLGALYDATGNLVAPIVAHAGINAVNLHRLSREYGS
jgi:hypothetical protein